MQTFDEWINDAIFTQRFRTHYEWMRLAWDAALATASERIRELEASEQKLGLLLAGSARTENEALAALAAEREVSDKLVAALENYIQHMNLADARAALAEVAAIRAKQNQPDS